MAVTAKSAGSATIDATGGNAFDASVNGGSCAAFEVSNPTGNLNNFLINIPGLHAANEFFTLTPGRNKEFFLRSSSKSPDGSLVGGISTVFIKCSSGSQTCTWGVVGK